MSIPYFHLKSGGAFFIILTSTAFGVVITQYETLFHDSQTFSYFCNMSESASDSCKRFELVRKHVNTKKTWSKLELSTQLFALPNPMFETRSFCLAAIKVEYILGALHSNEIFLAPPNRPPDISHIFLHSTFGKMYITVLHRVSLSVLKLE